MKGNALSLAFIMIAGSLAGCMGTDSTPGPAGEQGSDGLNSIASLINEAPGPYCKNGGTRIDVGVDLNSDQILSLSEVSQTQYICNGEYTNGLNSIIATNDITESSQCPDGGVLIEMGLDSNSNSELDSDEISQTQYICSGANGADGLNGTNGVDGEDGQDGLPGIQGENGTHGIDGLTSLLDIAAEISGENCVNGGVRIQTGMDDNEDGILNSDEIDATEYVCDGGSSVFTTLTKMSTPDIGQCSAGGSVIESGLDNGDSGGAPANGELEDGEVDLRTTFCSEYTLGLLKDIYPGTTGSQSSSYEKVESRGLLFFVADTPLYGTELWISDGTYDGTNLIKDICPGSSSSTPDQLTAVGDGIFFQANDCINGDELWYSNGTSSGTMLVKDINPGSSSGYIQHITAAGESVFFSGYNASNGKGYELWTSNGTESGTFMVKDIYPDSSSSSPNNFAAIGDEVFFTALDPTSGRELWKSNGTESGTFMVKDIYSGGTTSGLDHLTNYNGTLFFTANDGIAGYELWKSDGTASGTTMVNDIYYGSSSSSPYHLTVVGNSLFFVACISSTYGCELWQTDGTETGTDVVFDIVYGSTSSMPEELTAVGNELYFSANDGGSTNNHGRELWKSDGTAAGTTLVLDIAIGTGSSTPEYLVNSGGILYFVADDGYRGDEIWRSDGSVDGTYLVSDVKFGPSSSNPYDLISAGGVLFYLCAENYGTELWSNSYVETTTIIG